MNICVIDMIWKMELCICILMVWLQVCAFVLGMFVSEFDFWMKTKKNSLQMGDSVSIYSSGQKNYVCFQ
jgi:hypothetical protein